MLKNAYLHQSLHIQQCKYVVYVYFFLLEAKANKATYSMRLGEKKLVMFCEVTLFGEEGSFSRNI